jgi:hypothetical protein
MVELVAPPYIRDGQGVLTLDWWLSLPLRAIMSLPGTAPEPNCVPLLNALPGVPIVNGKPTFREMGVEKFGAILHDWTGGILGDNGLFYIFAQGGHGGGANNVGIEIDFKTMTYRLVYRPTMFTTAMVQHIQTKIPSPTNWPGRVDYGYDGLVATFYPDEQEFTKRGKPTAIHGFQLQVWDSRRKRAFDHRCTHAIAWIPTEERHVVLAPLKAYTSYSYGKHFFHEGLDEVFQFAPRTAVGEWSYRQLDPETGETKTHIDANGVVRDKRTLTDANYLGGTYNFVYQDASAMVGDEIVFNGPGRQVSFTLNCLSHTTRKLNIVFPPELIWSGVTQSLTHWEDKKFLVKTNKLVDNVNTGALYVQDIEAQTIVPFEHTGKVPLSKNGDYRRFGIWTMPNGLKIAYFVTQASADIRVMRLNDLPPTQATETET